MRYILIVILFIGCKKEMSIKGFTTGVKRNARITNPLFVFTGESNAGGYALNSELTSPQLASRPAIKIMNNTLEGHTFVDLQIGLYNNINHSGLDATTHGIENGLCTAVENGAFSVSSVHLIQTGQGGSRIANWLNDSSVYNDKNPWLLFHQRVDAALSQDSTYSIIIFYSQGINDIVDGLATSSWKIATKNHFAKIRAMYGAGVPIFMTKFYQTGYTTYNDAMDQICAEVPNTFIIDTNGATQRDDKHWDSAGYDTVAARFVARIKEVYVL